MSITGVLNTAVTGLFATQTALRTISNNIANINTEGYARQVVSLENIVVGGASAGVQVTDIQRVVDRFLQAAGLDANARSSETDTENEFHERFQGLLGRPDSGGTIAARISRLFSVIADLTLDPSGQMLRQSALASMQDMADEINRVSIAIQDLRNEASRQIQEQVFAANEALSRIHALNPQIVRQRAISGEAAGLENRRDQALKELSEVIDIRISRNADGTIGVATISGAVLLDSSLRELEYVASGAVTSEALFNPIQIWRIDNLSGQRVGTARDFDHQISSGTLRGLLDLRDNDLRDLSLALGEFSAKFIDQVNAIHNAHTAVPPPNQFVSRQTQISSSVSHNFTGIATFGVVDVNNQLVQKVAIDFGDPGLPDMVAVTTAVNAALGGTGTLTMAGGVLSFAATDPTHGVVIVDDPATPTSRGGQGISHFFGMNDLLEASVRANYDTGLTLADPQNAAAGTTTTFEVRDRDGRILTEYTLDPNAAGPTYGDIINDLNAASALGTYFTFSLDANGALVVAENSGFESARLNVVSDTTSMGATTGIEFTELFGIGDKYRVNPSKGIQIISRIAQQPTELALSSFDLAAAIGAVALSKGDQTGALAIQALENAIVGFDPAGELSNMSVSLGQYAAAFYSSAGLKASRASARAEDQYGLLAEINTRIADVSGVNLDEELANMVVLQNSFNAAARLITTSEEMFDALLNAV